jgi:uncharacterized protein involved in exopolysaccharide biosynthesis
MSEQKYPVQKVGEDRMDMRSLVEVLIRRRWIILAVALPVILAATVGTLRSTQVFRARTTMMIEISSPQTPSFLRQTPNLDMVLSSAAELGMSTPVARLAAEALVDSLPRLQRDLPEWFADVQTVDDLQGVIHGGVNSNHVGESNLLNLSFSHPDPGFALMGADALADAFIEFNINTRRNSPAVGYYTDQIVNTQSEIDSLMTIRTAVLEASGMVGMQADLKVSFNQIRGLESEYFTARSRREGLEARIRGTEAAIAQDPDYVPPVSSAEAASLNRLKGELDTKVARLTELRQRYKDDSTWVMREREQIELLRDEIVRERARYLESLRIELAQARSVEQSFLAAQQAQASDLTAYPAVRGRIETLDMEIDSLRRLLHNLQMKRGEVRMATSSDMRISDILLIEEPVLDVPVGRGRKILYLIISVVLAIAMGLVAAFFVESNDHRIYDRRRAEMYLEVPVLGSLPDTAHRQRS